LLNKDVVSLSSSSSSEEEEEEEEQKKTKQHSLYSTKNTSLILAPFFINIFKSFVISLDVCRSDV
jgi:hypothetical protein